MFTEEVELQSVWFDDLSHDDMVSLGGKCKPNGRVEKIDKVVGVDLDNWKFGTHRVDLSVIDSIPIPEPRVTIRIVNGAWYGYWYPTRGLFVPIDFNGAWETPVVGIKKQLFLLKEGTQ